jgi:hypothetical protein
MASASDVCPNYTRIAIGHKKGLHEAILVRVRCKQWTCGHCAEINRRQWQRRLIEGVKALQGHWSFWTLTHDLEADTPYVDQRQRLSQCANRLNTLIKRKLTYAPAYVRVIEIGKQGTMRMHHHLLLNISCAPYIDCAHWDGQPFVSSRWWHELVVAAGYGRIADIRPVTEHVADRPLQEQAAYVSSYVTKYMSKLDMANFYPKYTRRFNLSRNWPTVAHDEEFQSDLQWEAYGAINRVILSGYWLRGYHVRDAQRGERITLDDLTPDDDGLWVDPVLCRA